MKNLYFERMRNAALPLLLLMLFSMTVRSQEKESFYVFDAQWQPTKYDSARYLLHVHQVSDTCWQWDYYNIAGPLVKMEQYRDKAGKELNGITRYFNSKGWLDSAETYRRGKKNGDAFRISSDSFHITMKYVYRNDSLVEVIDPAKQKTDPTSKDTVERESEFPGGVKQWLRYMSKNLKYPDRAVNGNIEGEVRILFIVDKDGGILDPYVGKSVEYSLDEEALRIIRTSGKWVPAFQNGKIVKSYKIQPVVFRLQ